MIVESRQNLRILDFDIENKPVSYGGMDFTFGVVTAIACCWADDPKSMRVWFRDRNTPTVHFPKAHLLAIRALFAEAGILTGHFIRRHDLPALNGEFLMAGLPPMPERLTIDTKSDLTARGLISHSQENLAAYLFRAEAKLHMTEMDWREANLFLPAGVEKAKKRAVDDVIQHMALRTELNRIGHLGEPKTWRP